MNLSTRNILLTWQGGNLGYPIICLELYTKWYDVYVVQVDGSIETVPSDLFLDLASRGAESVVIDHDYHPNFLQRVADHYGGQVCELSKELAMGRWFLTYNNTGPEVMEP